MLPAPAADLSGKVVSIADGDTFTLLAPGNRQVKIRPAGIDTPKRGQPCWDKARRPLSGLVLGKQVTALEQPTDPHERILAVERWRYTMSDQVQTDCSGRRVPAASIAENLEAAGLNLAALKTGDLSTARGSGVRISTGAS